jgi:single-strand DNA-binding protein
MSVAINIVCLGGHLTRDPEIKVVGQHTVANFSLAINRSFKGNDGQKKEEVTFVDCEAWGRTAELVTQYCPKGAAVFVEGRLKLENWQDKDGHKRSRIKVVAESVQFLSSQGREARAGAASPPAPSSDGVTPTASPPPSRGDDEPPF